MSGQHSNKCIAALCRALVDVFNGPLEIEHHARVALRSTEGAPRPFDPVPLTPDFRYVMNQPNAHPACRTILETRLPWAPPTTIDDPAYVADSLPKICVELIGPDGIFYSDSARMGLYGMRANHEYGDRTHPAEEVFVMIAGEAYWRSGSAEYTLLSPGGRSYHESMTPHANKTGTSAFLSAYIWHGDVATDNYVYSGRAANTGIENALP